MNLGCAGASKAQERVQNLALVREILFPFGLWVFEPDRLLDRSLGIYSEYRITSFPARRG